MDETKMSEDDLLSRAQRLVVMEHRCKGLKYLTGWRWIPGSGHVSKEEADAHYNAVTSLPQTAFKQAQQKANQVFADAGMAEWSLSLPEGVSEELTPMHCNGYAIKLPDTAASGAEMSVEDSQDPEQDLTKPLHWKLNVQTITHKELVTHYERKLSPAQIWSIVQTLPVTQGQ